jgi:hypothetical protein
MSRFFRKIPSSDTDSSDSESLEEHEDDRYSRNDDDLSASRELEIAAQPVEHGPSDAIAVAGPNKDLLLHALLEEKCLNDVRKEHDGKPVGESAIAIEARNRLDTLVCYIDMLQIILMCRQISSPQYPISSRWANGCGSRRRCTRGCSPTIP